MKGNDRLKVQGNVSWHVRKGVRWIGKKIIAFNPDSALDY